MKVISWISAFAAISTAASRHHDGIVKTNGVQFELDGKPYSYAGTNTFWAAFLANESLIEETFKDVHDVGYRVMRFWAFADWIIGQPQAERIEDSQVWFQSWKHGKPTINYGENGLQRIDQVVKAAEKYDVKLIVTLTNNWIDFCGMDCYVNATSPGSPHDLFYRDPTIIKYFKEYTKAIVNRYKNSKAIFAWELANEARCTGSTAQPIGTCVPATITKWANHISTYIKTLDPHHMVSFGGEGFFNWPNRTDYEYDGGSGQDYDAELRLKNIDFGTLHLYPNGANEDIPWTMQWLADHNKASIAANKPVVVEEYGYPRANSTPSRLEVYSKWHDYILDSEAINGDMIWVFGDDAFRAYGGLPNDTYAVFPNDTDFKPLVPQWAKRMSHKFH